MQNSSEFKYIAIDTVHESATNPRRTFDEYKLAELAESIRTNGLIQPITVRPNSVGFEIVAGARRFRAAQLAELFSLPARIVDIDDAQTLEWQLVENSQRVDVHPYEEAQGFQRLLDMPAYDVATLVEKSGKSASHIYARLSLLQLIPAIAEAFSAERITASHANLLARLRRSHRPRPSSNAGAKTGRTRSRTCYPPSTSRRGYRPTSTSPLPMHRSARKTPPLTHSQELALPALAAAVSTRPYLPTCRAISAWTPLAFTRRSTPTSTAKLPPILNSSRSRTDTAPRKNRGPEPSAAVPTAKLSSPRTIRTPTQCHRAKPRNPPLSSTASA